MKKILIIITSLLIIFTLSAHADNKPMRGVWVSTVLNLDFPSVQTADPETLKTNIDTIVENCAKMGFNAVFLQVRPSSDAIYPSNIYPWSRYLTGEQGKAPDGNFDPLLYWTQKCREYSIDIHAWINPYRITRQGEDEFNSLSSNNPAKLHPEWVVKYKDGNYYYNPAVPEVRSLVTEGIKEIIDNYDIDGIHMDDYFYPGTDFDDTASFEIYNNGEFSNISDWRRNNVNLLVQSIYDTVHNSGRDLVFGISPSGIWDNKKDNPLGSDTRGKSSYSQLYADSRKWVKENMVDYLAPQIYWEFGYSAADYEVLCKWWADVFEGSSAKLYIGLADYRTVNAESTSPWYNGAEIIRQMDYNNRTDTICGEIHFRYSMINSDENLKSIISEKYKREITVIVNGSKLSFDQPPMIVNSRTMVPFRAVFDALGAEVEWNSETKTVSAVRGNDVLTIDVGADFLEFNGVKKSLDSPAFIVNGRTLVPLRVISEVLNYDVTWNDITKTVEITNNAH